MISPCVAFNNHAGSTKSFDYVREHNDAVNRLDVITGREPITVDYAPGSVQVVEQHDGTRLALRKLDADYDVHDRLAAMAFLQKHAAKGQVVTGLLYVDPEAEDLHAHLNTVDAPLNGARGEGSLPRHRGAGKDQRQRCANGHYRQPGLYVANATSPVSSSDLRFDRTFGQPPETASINFVPSTFEPRGGSSASPPCRHGPDNSPPSRCPSCSRE